MSIAYTLEEFLAAPNNFTVVYLREKNITNDDCVKLAAALKANTTVTTVYLGTNQIGDQGAAAIAGSLKVNKTLTYVELHHNQIGDQGAADIADSLKVNTTFSQASLNNNQIGDQGAAAIADCLKVNKTLTYVDLLQNQIGDQGAAAIADALKDNKTLPQINLNKNKIGDQGAAAIADCLKVNKTVTHVPLQQNQIGDQGAAAIADCLKVNKTVTYIDLNYNHIGDQGLGLLKSGWQGNQSYLYVSGQNPAEDRPAIEVSKEQNLADSFGNDCFFAAFNDDIALVQKWLASRVNLNQADSNGKTLLWQAAFFGREQMVKLLLDKGAQLNGVVRADKAGHTPLESATLLNNTSIINMLKTALIVDHIYMGEDFDLQGLDLSLSSTQSKDNRHQFLDRLKANLINNGTPAHFPAENYKLKLQEYLQNILPDSFSEDIAILLENLHLNRAKVMDNVHRVLQEILQVDGMVYLVKIMSAKEEMVTLLTNSELLDKAIHELQGIILTMEEKQVFDALLERYDNLDPAVKALIKQNHPSIQEAADALLKVVDLEEKKVADNDKPKAQEEAKKAPLVKAEQEEEAKEYVADMDLADAKLFAVEAEQEEDANHNKTIKKVLNLIREGNDRLQEYSTKGILLLGDTGAGKSTLAILLSGRKLQAINDDERDDFIVEAMHPSNDIVIGHKMASETKVPNKCLTGNGAVVWDCPGFNDTKTVQEIANSFYIKRLFETNGAMKFVLVVPESYITTTTGRGKQFLETLSSFMNVFSNLDDVENSISLVVTQVPAKKITLNIKKSIEKILNENKKVTPEQKAFVNKLINSSLHLFHKPEEEGELAVVNLLEAIEGSCEYVKASPDMASISISAEAKECSAQLLSTAASNFNHILEIIVKSTLEATNCLSITENNIFMQNYQLIQEWLPQNIHYKDLTEHNNNEYFLKLDLLVKLKNVLGSGQIGSMNEGLAVLRQVVDTIAEYADDNNLKHMIQGFSYCLEQQYEYAKFFGNVCGVELPDSLQLSGLIANCHAKVVENLEYQVSTMNISEIQFDSAYYHKAINYLENYPASKPCLKLKSIAYKGLAKIMELTGNYNEAIGYYIEAIEANSHQPDLYEKLGKLFCDKGEYAKAIDCYRVVNNEYEIKACFKTWLKPDPKNPHIMLKEAEYFEAIGMFESAKKYYHHVFSLSKDENIKAYALEKIGNITLNANIIGQEFITRAEEHNFYNYDMVNAEFIHNLMMGETPLATDFLG